MRRRWDTNSIISWVGLYVLIAGGALVTAFLTGNPSVWGGAFQIAVWGLIPLGLGLAYITWQYFHPDD